MSINPQIMSIAIVCHEANRAYCATLGDSSQAAWGEAPEWQRDSATSGVEKIARGEVTRPEQSHESWLAQKAADGWKYGPVKNAATKEHPCCVPYGDLPPEQQKKDALFFAVATSLLAPSGSPSLETPSRTESDIAQTVARGELE